MARVSLNLARNQGSVVRQKVSWPRIAGLAYSRGAQGYSREACWMNTCGLGLSGPIATVSSAPVLTAEPGLSALAAFDKVPVRAPSSVIEGASRASWELSVAGVESCIAIPGPRDSLGLTALFDRR